jgi:FixJ family two-component response regulator
MINPRGRVFVVDDDSRVLKSLSRLLHSADFEVAAFTSPEAFLEQHTVRPDAIAVLDVAMPGLNGLELQKKLAERHETIPIIFLTGHGNIPIAVQAIRDGAVTFLTKPVNDDLLLDAIEEALKKARAAWNAKRDKEELEMRMSRLSPRERQVMELVITGKLNKQIAGDLEIAEKTVKVHRARVMRKMDVVSLADLVRLVEHARGS